MKGIVFIPFILFSFILKSQNLVLDSSFENKINCPKSFSNKGLRFITKNWYVPTKATSDYFNKCGFGDGGVPRNFAGNRSPKSGNAYAGIVVYSKKDINYREYLETSFYSPMLKDSLYCVKLSLCRPTYFLNSVNRLGIYFSKSEVKKKTQENLSFRPQIQFDSEILLSIGNNWKCIIATYKANGGEQFLTLGNFDSDSKTKIRTNEPPKKFKNRYLEFNNQAYFYIDDISVTPLSSNSECGCNDSKERDSTERNNDLNNDSNFIAQNYKVVDSLVLGNVSFESSSWALQRTELKLLHNFIYKLQSDTLQIVEILGHTDSLGLESTNVELSVKRAKSVADYLIKNGVSEERINYSGYGSAFPIDSNINEKGRLKNRRVEIKVYKKM
jgi:OmpA-OmpF porin, OOP family